MTDPAKPSQPATPAEQPAALPAAEITLEVFQQVQLRVATIRKAEAHLQADRLLVLQVELADGQMRQVVAGIRAWYQPEQLIGKQVVVVANLKPAKLRGIESQGMVLAASDGSQLGLLSPDRAIQPGSVVK